MTRPSPAPPSTAAPIRWNIGRVAGVAAFAGAALLCAGHATSIGVEIASAFRRGAPSVAVHPRDAVLLPLSVAFACLAAMGTLPDLEIARRPSRRASRARRADAVATRLFACVLVAVVVTPLARPVAALTLSEFAVGRGYAECPSPSPNRFGLRQWARTSAACRSDLR